MKARSKAMARKFIDIPNVGPRIAGDFKMLGFEKPLDLVGQDPFGLYQKLSTKTGEYQDPCVLDVFMSVVDFMDGASPRPWWHYTPERKKRYPNLGRKKVSF